MVHQQTRPWSHAECRPRSPMPRPAVAEGAQRLREVLTPSVLAPRQRERHDPRPPPRLLRLRHRRLPRPVIVASMGSLGWRRVPSSAAVQQVVARAGRLGGAPRQVSAQALTNRLDVWPAAVVGPLLAAVCARLPAHAPPALPHPGWAPGRPPGPRLALVSHSAPPGWRCTYFPGGFFARTANPNRGMVSSHERSYAKHLRLRSVVWGLCDRPSKRTKANICPL
jgi:hypothetical protein